MPNEPHLVYPEGPTCQPNCPGPHSMYHDGYADGYERGEAEARATLLDELRGEAKHRYVERTAALFLALLDDHKGA